MPRGNLNHNTKEVAVKRLQWRAGLSTLVVAGVLAGGCGDNPQEPAPADGTVIKTQVLGALEHALAAARGSDILDPGELGDAIVTGLGEGGSGAQNDFATGASTSGEFNAGAPTGGEFGTGSSTSGEFGTDSGLSLGIGSTSLEGSGTGIALDFIDALELFSAFDTQAIVDHILNNGIPAVSPGSSLDVSWSGSAPQWEFLYASAGVDASGNLEGSSGDSMLIDGTSTTIEIPDYSYFGFLFVIVYPYSETPGGFDYNQIQVGFALITDQSVLGSLLP